MIRPALAALAGIVIGYSYGYLEAERGNASVVDDALTAVGLDRVLYGAAGSVRRVRAEEDRRQLMIDSIRQARADSIASVLDR